MPSNRPFLSLHAVDQSTKRSITRDEIQQTLANVQTQYPSEEADDRIVVLGTTENGRRLKIVVLRDDPNYIVTVADRDDEG
jgi:hypothetical protein